MPTLGAIFMTYHKKKKHFEMKFKKGAIKRECNAKLLLKLDKNNKLYKNHKFGKSNMMMSFNHAKSNMRLTILHVKNALPIGNQTMKRITMASSSSQCQSSLEALIPKTISHGH